MQLVPRVGFRALEKRMNKLFSVGVILLSTCASSSAFAALTEKESLDLLERFHNEFAPIVASHGAQLFTELDYTATSPGAMATRSANHKKWFIKIWGGFPKYPSTTGDSYTLILCHEMGHHIGGYPFYAHDLAEWAAAEGQADYWATQACAKRLWRNETEVNAAYANVKDSGCESIFSNIQEVNLCKRLYRATEVYAEMESKTYDDGRASIKKRDTSEVKELQVSHPKSQCRIDSTLMGVWCTKNFDFSIIPGRGNPLGQNTISAEKEARANSCFATDGFEFGNRPRCWFKESTLEKAPDPKFADVPELNWDNRIHENDELLPWLVN